MHEKEMETKRHIVLVHGASHGAWCWYELVPLLKLAGHQVTTVDLGASGINPKQIDDITSISDYLQPLMDFMSSLPQDEKVILVGHSFGGIGISLAMENFPEKVLAAVFVAAYMPNCSVPLITLQQEEIELAKMLVRPCGTFFIDLAKECPITEAKYGSINRIFVVCHDDGVMKEGFQRWVIENSPPKEVIVINKADDMVMLSKPQELCQCLHEIVQKY
ncbi:hypothetical protein Pint_28132 [Pistacia integerrima]|uniref:Uncharacterized protein n=1 Tax=Pistacia integerrima TaxID=434235 RepID=A0ACC0YQP2_9ROSI|nr:hypothetical protein Pint_28132 [Pistacia integerrima]